MLDDLLEKLTTNQLQDLRHRLIQTEESSTVLVPVGPKAFRLATLRFDKLRWSTPTDSDTIGYISKAQALDVLQYVISQRIPTKDKIDANVSGAPLEEAGKPGPTEGTSSSSSLPLMDIREEVDENGMPFRTEKIDVTNHLQHLVMVDKEQYDWPTGEEEYSNNIELDPTPMDRDEFEKLTIRLDELALLEEAGAEPNAALLVNRPAAKTALSSPRRKKAASTGWSKGFLNNNKQKTKAELQPNLATTKQATAKSVTFGRDQVHEIPKEGNQRPVPDNSLRQTRPIEPSLFTGTVQERPRRKKSTVGTANAPKLSRFAQERQQGLR